MDTIKFNKKNVKIIAHRGLSGIECENTNAAFVAAGNRSYFGIETDVHITADGKFAIIHDDTTARVSPGSELNVEESTLADLRKLSLCTYEADKNRSDLVIPELFEYISICKKYNKIAVLELKNGMPEEGIKAIYNVIKEYDYADNTIIISFDWDNLIKLKNIDSNANAQFLTCQYDEELIEKLDTNHLDLDILHTAVTKELVDKLHQLGLKINCWTCDNADDAEKLVELGVDFITSNILE